MDTFWLRLVCFNTKAIGKAERAPEGKIQKILMGFESTPVRLHVIFKLRVLIIFVDKAGTEHKSLDVHLSLDGTLHIQINYQQ